MKEPMIIWTQVFQDRDIPSTFLDNLQAKVMTQIMAQPVDFEQALLLARRRRWGLLLGGSILMTGLIILGLLGFVGKGILWPNIWPVLDSLRSMFKGVELIWQEYSWSMLGVTGILLLFLSEIRNPSTE